MKRALLVFSLFIGSIARAVTALPTAARAADLDEHLGAFLPLDALFIDEHGERRSLAALLRGRPLILVLGYYRCPMLCDLVLRGLADAMRGLSLALGRDYRALMVSIDPKETSAQALERQHTVLQAFGRPQATAEWPFVVADEETIAALTDRVGFRYAYDQRTDQYAHPAVVVVLTAEGRISRYLYGVEPAPRQLELALLEASRGQVGRLLDRVLLTCYRWDPALRRYRLLLDGVLKGGGLVVLILVGGMVIGLVRREHKRGVNA